MVLKRNDIPNTNYTGKISFYGHAESTSGKPNTYIDVHYVNGKESRLDGPSFESTDRRRQPNEYYIDGVKVAVGRTLPSTNRYGAEAKATIINFIKNTIQIFDKSPRANKVFCLIPSQMKTGWSKYANRDSYYYVMSGYNVVEFGKIDSNGKLVDRVKADPKETNQFWFGPKLKELAAGAAVQVVPAEVKANYERPNYTVTNTVLAKIPWFEAFYKLLSKTKSHKLSKVLIEAIKEIETKTPSLKTKEIGTDKLEITVEPEQLKSLTGAGSAKFIISEGNKVEVEFFGPNGNFPEKAVFIASTISTSGDGVTWSSGEQVDLRGWQQSVVARKTGCNVWYGNGAPSKPHGIVLIRSGYNDYVETIKMFYKGTLVERINCPDSLEENPFWWTSLDLLSLARKHNLTAFAVTQPLNSEYKKGELFTTRTVHASIGVTKEEVVTTDNEIKRTYLHLGVKHPSLEEFYTAFFKAKGFNVSNKIEATGISFEFNKSKTELENVELKVAGKTIKIIQKPSYKGEFWFAEPMYEEYILNFTKIVKFAKDYNIESLFDKGDGQLSSGAGSICLQMNELHGPSWVALTKNGQLSFDYRKPKFETFFPDGKWTANNTFEIPSSGISLHISDVKAIKPSITLTKAGMQNRVIIADAIFGIYDPKFIQNYVVPVVQESMPDYQAWKTLKEAHTKLYQSAMSNSVDWVCTSNGSYRKKSQTTEEKMAKEPFSNFGSVTKLDDVITTTFVDSNGSLHNLFGPAKTQVNVSKFETPKLGYFWHGSQVTKRQWQEYSFCHLYNGVESKDAKNLKSTKTKTFNFSFDSSDNVLSVSMYAGGVLIRTYEAPASAKDRAYFQSNASTLVSQLQVDYDNWIAINKNKFLIGLKMTTTASDYSSYYDYTNSTFYYWDEDNQNHHKFIYEFDTEYTKRALDEIQKQMDFSIGELKTTNFYKALQSLLPEGYVASPIGQAIVLNNENIMSVGEFHKYPCKTMKEAAEIEFKKFTEILQKNHDEKLKSLWKKVTPAPIGLLGNIAGAILSHRNKTEIKDAVQNVAVSEAVSGIADLFFSKKKGLVGSFMKNAIATKVQEQLASNDEEDTMDAYQEATKSPSGYNQR